MVVFSTLILHLTATTNEDRLALIHRMTSALWDTGREVLDREC